MEEDLFLKDSRLNDPYVDRRSGEERRQVYDADYFENQGLERRIHSERRQPAERRDRCVQVTTWSSVCPD